MSSRTAAARKRLQDPHPTVSPSKRSVNQAKPLASTGGADLIPSTPLLRNANITHTSTVHEQSAYRRQSGLSNELSQSLPSPEYSRTYSPHLQSSHTKPKRVGSSQATQAVSTYSPSVPYEDAHQPRRLLRLNPLHDVAYQTSPPPPSPRLQSPKRASNTKVLLSYVEQPPDLRLRSSYLPPSLTGYSSHSATSSLPPSSSSLHRSSSRSNSTDLPEYSSTCSSYADNDIDRPPFQNDDLSSGDNQHNPYQYRSSSRFGLPVSPSVSPTTLSPIKNESGLSHRNFPDAQTSSPSLSREPSGDSASFSGLSGYSGTSSTSTGRWQPPPPPPSPNFVFPGSRSVARPKVSSKIANSQLKLSSKSRLRRGKGPQGILHPLDIPPPNNQVFYETFPESPPFVQVPVQSNYPDTSHEENTVVLSGDLKRKTASGVRKLPTETFVFPTARSRAQPKLSRPSKSFSYASTSRDVSQPGGRSRFMGTLFKKKVKVPNLTPGPGAIGSDSVSSSPENAILREGRIEHTRRMRSRSGSYPLDPYNSVLLDNDRHTSELLSRLNHTGSPSFHDYGNAPPSSVLDLGCGQGHWVLEAAVAWKEYSTKVTGYDMVDISRNMLPCAAEHGVLENIRFVRGNFLKQQLPFGSNTFDLVRMSCLALCITSDSWGFVLQEVCRVLMTGGRLELIDDQIFFPYGSVCSLINDKSSIVESMAPRVDVVISPTATTFSIYGDLVANPGLGSTLEKRGSDGIDEVEDKSGLEDETVTLYGHKNRATAGTSPVQPRFNASPDLGRGLSPETWNRALTISEDLESLFEHMLLDDFDIHKDPSNFILSLMKQVFGRAREVKTMHVVLPAPDFTAQSECSPQGLSHCPGLILWPSTFIPMDHTEIEIHASKHLRTLLSCKSFLSRYAIQIAEDERVDEEFISEALWEYESFLRHRFNPPVPVPVPPSDESSDSDERSETTSIHSSIAESAMWEIQSEFRQRFAWLPERDPLNSRDDRPVVTPGSPVSPLSVRSAGDDRVPGSPARNEVTHVRTFRVYEAVKLDNRILN